MKTYLPLFSLVAISLIAAFAIAHGVQASTFQVMHYFMGFFFCQFSMLKIFNVKGFVEGFQKYDLLAMRFSFYGYVYPFLELALGIGYLSFVFPRFVYLATIFLMAVGAIGVIKALRKGLDLRCACMGTVLNVPLSTVTLTEGIGMLSMALLCLFLT